MLKIVIAPLAILLALNAAQAKPNIVGMKPNIVVIMTDDQDDLTNLDRMPYTQQLAADGVRFINSFVPFPLCGPSRGSFLTGQFPHNTGINKNIDAYANLAPQENSTLGVWLQAAGYRTALIGKFINGYHGSHVPPGWTDWRGFVKGNYYGASINENGVIVRYGSEDYVTTLLDDMARDFIRNTREPFFLLVTPKAPHIPAIPADRDKGDLADMPFPDRRNFNEADVSDKPLTIQALRVVEPHSMHKWFELREESLLSVDRMLGDIRATLVSSGKARNTILLFTSDNGYSLGWHRIYGKAKVYEETARVPLIVHWPGVQGGQTRGQLVNNIDLTATILDIAGASADRSIDGRSFRHLIDHPNAPWRNYLLIEGVLSEYPNPIIETEAIRSPNRFYAEHDSGESELYTLPSDPYELTNKTDWVTQADSKAHMHEKLNVLRSCAGDSCWLD